MPNEVEKAQERVEKLRAQVAAEEAKTTAKQAEGEDAVTLARLANEEAELQRRLDTAKESTRAVDGGKRMVSRIEAQTAALTADPSGKPMNPPPDGNPVSVDPDAASYEEMVKQSNTGPATGLTTTTETPTPAEAKAAAKGKE